MNTLSESALEVVKLLPAADYGVNYQPEYPDEEALIYAIHELQHTKPVTTPESIECLLSELGAIAKHAMRPVYIAGNCSEAVKLREPIDDVAQDVLLTRAAVLGAAPHALNIYRGMGQNFKPRSNEFEVTADGVQYVSFQGDGVNGSGYSNRVPDPTRMVAAALQARDLSTHVDSVLGEHLYTAHEVLLLPYEHAFVRTDPETGKKYLLSADLPWIGVRTNDPNGPHVELLSEVENSVGVKIDNTSSPEHIEQLYKKLNPRGIPGKIVFMLRFTNPGDAAEILEALHTRAPGSLQQWDIHGVTRSVEKGIKLRAVDEIIDQIGQLATACVSAGLSLNGLHLETTADGSRIECVDSANERPKHPGGVDPQLTLTQARRIITETKQYIGN
jgi:3-deoxy-7-phosphoheptulonate synthase